MSKLTLTILDSDQAALSVTEHDTLTEALNEYAGWAKQGATDYMVQGTMQVDCACKRVLESRNRLITVRMGAHLQPYSTCSNELTFFAQIEVKAPQAVKYLEAIAAQVEPMLQEGTKREYLRVNVVITSTELNLG